MKPSSPIIFAVAVLAFPLRAFSAITIQSFPSHRLIEILATTETLQIGDRLIIFGQDRSITGYAKVEHVEKSSFTGTIATASVLAHSQSNLILKGDQLEKVDLSHGNNDGFNGRADLLLDGSETASSRYKFLVYQGLIGGETAASLGKGENLLTLTGNYHYGITDKLTVSTWGYYDVSGVINFGAKYQLIDNEAVRFALGAQTYYNSRGQQSPLVAVQGFVDMPSNSRFISHTALNVYVNSAEEAGIQGTTAQALLRSTIQSGIEFVFDDWDRIVAGPLYNFDLNTVGGYLSYMWIWDHLHVSIGIKTDDFTTFKIGANNYYPALDVFWRF